jgi:aspartate--ammonia ligase
MLIIPKNYRPALDVRHTEEAVKTIKDAFQEKLADVLSLRRVTAPLFVLSGTGINDNLNGVERPVSFTVSAIGQRAEIVHSLAKWKRMKLGTYGIAPGEGLYADMNAIRADEEQLDNLHSVYVDQWDWERTVTADDRNLDFLKRIVRKIYGALLDVEATVCAEYRVQPWLSPDITFVHTEDMQILYPDLTPKERENKVAEQYGSIFLIGIGGTLPDGKIHDGRSPDYDDWSSETGDGHKGLNGDIILWNPLLKCAFEISSMGIRVDREALLRQLKIRNCEDRLELLFHKNLAENRLPLSIGGGVGQSRLCMYLLHCAHIGEVQSSVWPEEMVRVCAENNICLK